MMRTASKHQEDIISELLRSAVGQNKNSIAAESRRALYCALLYRAFVSGYSASMETWISFTLLAVVMQSVRTAGQKQIATKISPQAVTLVRYFFGLAFALIYFYWLQSG